MIYATHDPGSMSPIGLLEMLTAPNLRSPSTDWPELLRSIRRALSRDPEKPLSQEKLGRLLNVSWRTVARWESEYPPSGNNADKVLNLARALECLGDMLRPEDKLAFFEQPHPLLLNLRPITLLESDEGTKLVLEQLEAAASGSFA